MVCVCVRAEGRHTDRLPWQRCQFVCDSNNLDSLPSKNTRMGCRKTARHRNKDEYWLLNVAARGLANKLMQQKKRERKKTTLHDDTGTAIAYYLAQPIIKALHSHK